MQKIQDLERPAASGQHYRILCRCYDPASGRARSWCSRITADLETAMAEWKSHYDLHADEEHQRVMWQGATLKEIRRIA